MANKFKKAYKAFTYRAFKGMQQVTPSDEEKNFITEKMVGSDSDEISNSRSVEHCHSDSSSPSLETQIFGPGTFFGSRRRRRRRIIAAGVTFSPKSNYAFFNLAILKP